LHLIDFNLAKSSIYDENRINTSEGVIVGTAEYLAPEIYNDMTGKPDINKQDVWAIGVIAYQMCTFTLPFVGPSYKIEEIIDHPY
jgi:serine/threonine protein kinase